MYVYIIVIVKLRNEFRCKFIINLFVVMIIIILSRLCYKKKYRYIYDYYY